MEVIRGTKRVESVAGRGSTEEVDEGRLWSKVTRFRTKRHDGTSFSEWLHEPIFQISNQIKYIFFKSSIYVYGSVKKYKCELRMAFK